LIGRFLAIGKARWSWVDIEDVAAVAAACLLDPEKHNGQTYRLADFAKKHADKFRCQLTEKTV
jgi:NAD(P)H dehydrogenase (quinone)